MIVGTILLSQDDCYIDDRKQLPYRPSFDKGLLKSLISMNTITNKGFNLLPGSIMSVAKIDNYNPSMAVTIRELDAIADLLIVSRSPRKCRNGKKFRFTNYKLLVKTAELELWSRV